MKRRKGLSGPFLGGSQGGQGTLEYILVLVIVIIIILSFLYQFNSAFRNYAQAFFDGYIACLMETGELPGTGSTCKDEFAAYDSKSGKKYLKDNLPGGDGSSDGDGAGEDGAKADEGKKQEAARGEAMGGGGSGRSVGRFMGNSGRPRSEAVGRVGGDKSESSSEGGDSYIGMSNTQPIGRTSETYRQETMRVEYQFAQESTPEEKGRPQTQATKKTVSDPSALRPAKAIENLNRSVASRSVKEDREFSMGELIRFLFIVLIVVAMVIFFGGQLMQISRSREKGGGD